jgi:hypothetical protein
VISRSSIDPETLLVNVMVFPSGEAATISAVGPVGAVFREELEALDFARVAEERGARDLGVVEDAVFIGVDAGVDRLAARQAVLARELVVDPEHGRVAVAARGAGIAGRAGVAGRAGIARGSGVTRGTGRAGRAGVAVADEGSRIDLGRGEGSVAVIVNPREDGLVAILTVLAGRLGLGSKERGSDDGIAVTAAARREDRSDRDGERSIGHEVPLIRGLTGARDARS